MTDIEALKAELIHELENINEIKTLRSVRRVLNSIQSEKVAQTRVIEVANPAEQEWLQEQELPTIPAPCCYTIEELKSHLMESYKAYEQGEFFMSEESRKSKLKIKIGVTKIADNDLRLMKQYTDLAYTSSYLFSSQVEKLLEMLNFNTKSGKKDCLFADILDHKVRCLNINKYCFLYYVEIPEGVLILALQNSETPMDIRLHYKKNTAKIGNKVG